MSKPDFRNAQVGDEVESYRYGEGKIISINYDPQYPIPIRVKFESDIEADYTLEGLFVIGALRPDLFFKGVEFNITGGDVRPKRKVKTSYTEYAWRVFFSDGTSRTFENYGPAKDLQDKYGYAVLRLEGIHDIEVVE